MNARRTDLALEAHALFRAAQKDDAIDGTVAFAWGGLSHVPLMR